MVWSKYNDSIEVHYILKTGGLLSKRRVFLKLYFFPGTSILAGGRGKGEMMGLFSQLIYVLCVGFYGLLSYVSQLQMHTLLNKITDR